MYANKAPCSVQEVPDQLLVFLILNEQMKGIDTGKRDNAYTHRLRLTYDVKRDACPLCPLHQFGVQSNWSTGRGEGKKMLYREAPQVRDKLAKCNPTRHGESPSSTGCRGVSSPERHSQRSRA